MQPTKKVKPTQAEQAKALETTIKATFKKPLEIKGQPFTTVTIDLLKINGLVIINAVNTARGYGLTNPITPYVEPIVHACIVAELLGAKVDDILALPGDEFLSLTAPVNVFLLGMSDM